MTREVTVNTTYGSSHQYRLFTDEHVPYNKRPFEARDARGIVEITDYDGGAANPEPWTQIELREIETDKHGRDRAKTISITIRGEERARLIAMLTREG